MDISPTTGDPWAMRLASTTTLTALLLACTADTGTSVTDAGTSSATTSSASTSSGPGTTDTPSTGADTPTTGGPGDPLQRCQPTCTADADCSVAGADIGFRCVAGLCRPPPCSDDAGCVLTLSGWTEPCGEQAACPRGQACIDVGGEGRCALVPGMIFACVDLGLDERMMPTIEGGMILTVCGVITATCSAGTCTAPCTSDAACPAHLGHPRCEQATGACICTDDRDCQDTMKPGLIACVDGRCGCRSDMDCTGGVNVDTCYAGACGCASTASCDQQVFDGVTQICGPA